jgi:hypothetical protein
MNETAQPLLELDAVDTFYGPIHILQSPVSYTHSPSPRDS